MESENQLSIVKAHSKGFELPFLEVGSKAYGESNRISSLFPDEDFTGIDMIDGDNVDFVLDLTNRLKK